MGKKPMFDVMNEEKAIWVGKGLGAVAGLMREFLKIDR